MANGDVYVVLSQGQTGAKKSSFSVVVRFLPYILLFFAVLYMFNKITESSSRSGLDEALSKVEPFDPNRDKSVKLALIGTALVFVVVIILWRVKK